jgi:hypothetical protein
MDFYDIIFRPVCLNVKKRLEWKELWIKKSEYIEKLCFSMKGQYRIIDESINYYIAMLEMAIYYLKDYDNYYDYIYVQHNIILDDFFKNDINVRYDIRERDFAEYLKYIFFNMQYKSVDIYSLLEKGKNIFNYDLVVARLLFPSYYYLYLEKYILNSDEKIFEIVDRHLEFEEYVKMIVNIMNYLGQKKIIIPFK